MPQICTWFSFGGRNHLGFFGSSWVSDIEIKQAHLAVVYRLFCSRTALTLRLCTRVSSGAPEVWGSVSVEDYDKQETVITRTGLLSNSNEHFLVSESIRSTFNEFICPVLTMTHHSNLYRGEIEEAFA